MDQSVHDWWNISDVREILGGEQMYIAHGRLNGTDYMDSWACFYNEDAGKFYCCEDSPAVINKEVLDVDWVTLYPMFSYTTSTKSVPHEITFALAKMLLIMDQHIEDVDAHQEGAEAAKKVAAFVKLALNRYKEEQN